MRHPLQSWSFSRGFYFWFWERLSFEGANRLPAKVVGPESKDGLSEMSSRDFERTKRLGVLIMIPL